MKQTKIKPKSLFFFFMPFQLGKVGFATTYGLCRVIPLEQGGGLSPPQLPQLPVLPSWLCRSLLLPKMPVTRGSLFFLSLHHPAFPPRKVRRSEGRCLVRSEGARQRGAVTDRKPFALISLCRSLAFLLGAVSPLMRSTYPALPSHLARPSLPPCPAGLQGFSPGSRCLEEAGRGYVRR